MLRKLLLIQLFLFVVLATNAQVPNISPAQASQVNVDNLSDDQIRQIVADMKKNGMGMGDIDLYAEQKGVSQAQADKLKDRIQQLGLDKTLGQKSLPAQNTQPQTTERQYTDSSGIDLFLQNGERTAVPRNQKHVFGYDLFHNKNLTFEPNLRMATPPNYKLAAEDQVLIDVYGYSEAQYTLNVSAEGYIRIPNVGPVFVNGLTMDEAKKRITKQLSVIYSTIPTGQTSIQISLGNIRSIRVLLIGEVENPGTYTLPSLATVANALYVSGGPDENGSFRNIQVIRNGVTAATFDLYDFISRGDLTNNIVLQDQDIVKVNPYQTRVELTGAVKRQAIFEAKDKESLNDIIGYAGGFTDNAYKDNLIVYRNTQKEKEVLNIPADKVATFTLKSGDQFIVDSILARFTNRVTIVGAVFHPGDYGLEEGMNLGDLIRKADGLKENASLNRGIIRRLQADYTPALINFDVQQVVSGANVIPLQKEDSVIIFSKQDLHAPYTVSINGEVNQPGTFRYADSMHLEDVILLAGGLSDAASLKRVEVSRRIRGNGDFNQQDSNRVLIMQFDINADLKSIENANVALQPFDEIVIRRSPQYGEQANVKVDGEVVYPGSYVIVNKSERISDIVKRAGGFKPGAFPEGAVLLRKTFVNSSDSALLNNKLELFYSKLEDSLTIDNVKRMMERKYQLLGINLGKIMKNPGSKFDVLLEEGDVLKIPKKLETIQLFGEIYFPKKIKYDNGISFRDYIRGAGGFTSSALRRRSYVVYANGDVKSTKKVFFFNSFPKLKPGAEIYVPSKKEKPGLSGQELIGFGSGLASLALVLFTILNQTK